MTIGMVLNGLKNLIIYKMTNLHVLIFYSKLVAFISLGFILSSYLISILIFTLTLRNAEFVSKVLD